MPLRRGIPKETCIASATSRKNRNDSANTSVNGDDNDGSDNDDDGNDRETRTTGARAFTFLKVSPE